MSAEERIVLAIVAPERAPDWPAGRAHVESFTFGQLEELLESPATFDFHEFGVGLERVKEGLMADLTLVREAIESGHEELARFETYGLTVYAAFDEVPDGSLFAVVDRLRWSGTLEAAGFDVPGGR